MHAFLLWAIEPPKQSRKFDGPLTIKRSKASYITIKVLAEPRCLLLTFLTDSKQSTGKLLPPCPFSISKFKDKDIPQEELEHFFTEEMVIFDLICSTNEAKIFLATSAPMTGPCLLARVDLLLLLLLFSSWVISDSFAIPWTVAHQASLSVGFPRQESWSGLPFLSPGDLPNIINNSLFSRGSLWKGELLTN